MVAVEELHGPSGFVRVVGNPGLVYIVWIAHVHKFHAVESGLGWVGH